LLFEAALSCAAIVALLPFFEVFSANELGRDARFANDAAVVAVLPPLVLRAVCRSQGALAEPWLRDRLCGSVRVSSVETGAIPAALADAAGRAKAAVDSASLACAHAMVAATAAGRDAGHANAVLLLAAALDGHPATASLARQAALPDVARATRRNCASLAEALAATSALMADARQASLNAGKNVAMRELMRTAGVQWAAAMLLGLLFVMLSRRVRSAGAGCALALATWAIAAWSARVPWPLAGEHLFVPAREAVAPSAAPAPFVWMLLAAAAVVMVSSFGLRNALRVTPQTAASRIGYPGFVIATGVGFLLVLDLSANASFGNRYLALYHQGHLWLALLALSVIVFLRQPLGRLLAWTLAMVDGLASSAARRLGAGPGVAILLVVMVVLSGAFGALLSNLRQVTSELGRLWLMVGSAWFFFMRGTPFAERLARSGSSLGSLARYVLPLAFVVLVLVGAMFVTRDMGPLLIAGYAAGAFLAASAAMWMHQRFDATSTAYALAVALFIAWIVGITAALFQVGPFDEVTAGRLENLAAPLASANDQLALVTWFQQVAPPAGFGLGAVPWCGYSGSSGCAGVPAQIQSDYTFTAIVGAFGWTAAWALTLGCAVWLHRLIRHHARVTRGEPRLVKSSDRMANDEQALLSWIAVTWVVLTLCQLAVTVAGNLAVIPLTGVTFPFVSFGMTSLVVNAALLALCLNVNVSAWK
jgi:cell division protein FtsW (lipid II flippase)